MFTPEWMPRGHFEPWACPREASDAEGCRNPNRLERCGCGRVAVLGHSLVPGRLARRTASSVPFPQRPPRPTPPHPRACRPAHRGPPAPAPPVCLWARVLALGWSGLFYWHLPVPSLIGRAAPTSSPVEFSLDGSMVVSPWKISSQGHSDAFNTPGQPEISSPRDT